MQDGNGLVKESYRLHIGSNVQPMRVVAIIAIMSAGEGVPEGLDPLLGAGDYYLTRLGALHEPDADAESVHTLVRDAGLYFLLCEVGYQLDYLCFTQVNLHGVPLLSYGPKPG